MCSVFKVPFLLYDVHSFVKMGEKNDFRGRRGICRKNVLYEAVIKGEKIIHP